MRDRIIQLLHDFAPDVILVLSAIAVFLVVPDLLQPLLGSNSRESTELSLKLLATFLAVVASIASYRRFFRGRLFSPRLTLKLNCSNVCCMKDGAVLHGLDVHLENVGGVTVWNPELNVRVLELDDDVDCTTRGMATEGISQLLRPGGLSGIEPSETVVYHYRFRVPENVEAFRVSVEVSTARRHAWHRSMTVSNASN